MMRYIWVGIIGIAWFVMLSQQSCEAEEIATPNSQTSCIEVAREDDYALVIKKPGRYCWVHDIKKTCPSRWVARWIYLGETGCGGIGIHIYADDVELDFQGHTLTTRNAGITVDVYGKRVTIHNGIFIGSTKMMLFRPKGPPPFRAMPDIELRSVKLLVPADVKLARSSKEKMTPFDPHIAYEDLDSVIDETGYVIENMTIDSKRADTILMNGTGNIVRNNRINIRAINLVDKEGKALKNIDDGSGGAAHYPDVRVGIINYGANTLIENNEIIQRTDNKGVIPAYSIYLRKADGSIVRGNTIKLSGTKKKTIAIGVRDTQNAVIENNKITGAETPIEQVGESSSQQSNNQFK